MLARFPLALATLKGGFRDRLLLGLFVVSLLLVCTLPIFGSFSMRDVTAAATTFSLSAVSAIGVLLVLLIGSALVPRDIQSRSIYSVATLPISRTRYLLEKYLGLSLLLAASLALMGTLNCVGIWLMSGAYPPDRPVVWGNYLLYLIFDLEKLLVLASVLVFFSAVATSSFLPMILTLAVYAVGMTTEKVKLFVETAQGAERMSPFLRGVVQVIYYLFPNLTPFDLKVQMIYALPVDPKALLLTSLYGFGYVVVMLTLASCAFSRRDFI
ncbi:ABC transporter permease [Geomonas sp. Red69]|uniref:ABC transporter permease n=1 Tax=Geomonas diazotrophica TaxID=2843197 RepID=A0ABX8JPK5_9BACT|nr:MULTISPECIES: ABC transporter permease [Geomonas]MBU5636471.1 ABC transporter permease [Geomonas diazotrophica]QWV99026.1 ABC transporter permease [Geomonas nitrogeniifigens]QXE88192.1 ABC transporter permease [Geomonas nitrogeniifigens]